MPSPPVGVERLVTPSPPHCTEPVDFHADPVPRCSTIAYAHVATVVWVLNGLLGRRLPCVWGATIAYAHVAALWVQNGLLGRRLPLIGAKRFILVDTNVWTSAIRRRINAQRGGGMERINPGTSEHV